MIEKINVQNVSAKITIANETEIATIATGAIVGVFTETINSKIDEINNEIRSLRNDLDIIKKRNEELQDENAAFYAEE